MITLHGKGVSPGITAGPLRYILNSAPRIEQKTAASPDREIVRLHTARLTAVSQLESLSADAAQKLGKKNALVFEAHQMMLQDPDFIGPMVRMIETEKVTAEYAFQEASARFISSLADAEDDDLRSRITDLRDITRRVLAILTGDSEDASALNEPAILAAEEFTPSQTARFDRNNVLALVSRRGTANSHAAIFARTMGIPAITGLGEALSEDLSGRRAALDGSSGMLAIDPDDQTLRDLEARRARLAAEREGLERCRGKAAVTKDGRSIRVCANIGSVEDVHAAIAGGAEGIGLFRSEFLFLGRQDYPGEDLQYQSYRKVLEAMGGQQVIIRTLDIGADKRADYFGLPGEENPAMGMRAIRLCLTRPALFKTQLRAIYRAAAHGNGAIMFPLISSVEELRRAKALAAEARQELVAEQIPFNPGIPIGIMIETPAAAIISDLLAKEADFFSIGTNDLTQYTLAMDRQNEALDQFRDTHHQAVLRLIRMTVQNAHRAGIWAGICGALAADLELTAAFVEMEIDELSVEPSQALALRKAIAGS
jgi:phosphotransferase system enzyme I (PtsI)